MTPTSLYAEIVLPLALEQKYTYAVPESMNGQIEPGMRVAVQLGKQKVYTGLVWSLHSNKPLDFVPKEILELLEPHAVIKPQQLKLWEWMADYYLCTLGDIFKSALPSALKLESETKIVHDPECSIAEDDLSDEEFLVYEALQQQASLSVLELSAIVSKKNVIPLLRSLMEKGIVDIYEDYQERYRPKLESYVKLNEALAEDENALHEELDGLKRAKRQQDTLLAYLHLSEEKEWVKKSILMKSEGCSPAALTSLAQKEILIVEKKEVSRLENEAESSDSPQLSPPQEKAYQGIKQGFEQNKVCLLHGVTGSGKTEIYVKLIEEALAKGKQVLYLLPEIALTTQLINRLTKFFGKKVGVYHSRYNNQERVEVWNRAGSSSKDDRFEIILGARSAVFLPFSDLGLVIVDEEHEQSFKQQDPAPRYHGRDLAIVLGKTYKAQILLGSATPAVESYTNAQSGKYHLVTLKERYSGVMMPEIKMADMKHYYRKKQMRGHFTPDLFDAIRDALDQKRQVILFQNRRGYAPVMECQTCGHVPQCPHCDVSLTYHKHRNQLRCHYCGYSHPKPVACPSCKSVAISTKGFGTEQVEQELHLLFPESKVARMDLDTTRKKHAYKALISKFENRDIDILVGTQMLSKGLDFDNVSLVGILNADNMLSIPDFRAHERAFQLIAQVSGRAGRQKERGMVWVQSFEPGSKLLQQVSRNDYEGMYQDQIYERRHFRYPPYFRMIKITLKHKDVNVLNAAATQLAHALSNQFPNNILGPEFPHVPRVKNLFIKHLYIKIPHNQDMSKAKKFIKRVKHNFHGNKAYRSVRFTADVDPM